MDIAQTQRPFRSEPLSRENTRNSMESIKTILANHTPSKSNISAILHKTSAFADEGETPRIATQNVETQQSEIDKQSSFNINESLISNLSERYNSLASATRQPQKATLIRRHTDTNSGDSGALHSSGKRNAERVTRLLSEAWLGRKATDTPRHTDNATPRFSDRFSSQNLSRPFQPFDDELDASTLQPQTIESTDQHDLETGSPQPLPKNAATETLKERVVRIATPVIQPIFNSLGLTTTPD